MNNEPNIKDSLKRLNYALRHFICAILLDWVCLINPKTGMEANILIRNLANYYKEITAYDKFKKQKQ